MISDTKIVFNRFVTFFVSLAWIEQTKNERLHNNFPTKNQNEVISCLYSKYLDPVVTRQ